MSFLPPNTQVPNTPGQFLKLDEGTHRFRVLDSAIIGVEYWTEITGDDGSVKRLPKRVYVGDNIPVGELAPDSLPKTFWAFPIYNYDTATIQTLSLTQKTLMKKLKAYVDDEEYGDPTTYDIAITREGKGLDTEYELIAKPPKPMDKDIEKQFAELKSSRQYDINRLYTGEYPMLNEPPVNTDQIDDNDLDKIIETL